LKSLSLVLTTLLFAGPTSAEVETEWKLTGNQDGILTYSRRTPGSRFATLRGITVIDARMETIGQVLRDISAYPDWMHKCKSSSVISKVDDNNMTVHVVMGLPVVADRDLVVKADTVYDLSKARGIVNLGLVEDSSVPIPEEAARMREFTGTFVFEYLTREKTGMAYTYHADPGGALPAFAVDRMGKAIIHRTLFNLKQAVKKSQYLEAGRRSADRELFEAILGDTERVRAIMRSRIMEHCRDAEYVQAIVADQAVFDFFINGDGKAAEQIFMSWGSRDNLETAVRAVLAVYARKRAPDDKIIQAMCDDKKLIDAIIDGKKADRPPAMDILRSHMSLDQQTNRAAP
jgi:hypothetical protein